MLASLAGQCVLLLLRWGGSEVACRTRLSPWLFFLPGRTLVAPRLVLASAGCASSGCILIQLRWAVPGLMLLRTVATCGCRLALGSYVAVVLTLVALLQSTPSLVSLALKGLALPNQTLVDNLFGILRLRELYNDAGCSFGMRVSRQLPYVLDLCLRDERLIYLQYLVSRLCEPGHVQ